MRIANIILFFFFINLSTVYSQNKLDIFIKDDLGKVLPYASVIWNKSMGLVSDSAGYLQIPDKSIIDSLVVSAVGFSNITISKDSVLNRSRINIVLEHTVIELPEVIIAKYGVENELGCADGKRQTSYIKNGICSNIQGALLIKNYNYPAQCKSISVYVAKQSSDDIPYRLRLYEIGKDNLPGKDLLSENLIVKSYKTDSWNTYNLDSITVQLPRNGFYVAIEWLCTDIKTENELSIGLTNKIEDHLTYYKHGNVGWFQLRFKDEISKDNIMLKANIASVQ